MIAKKKSGATQAAQLAAKERDGAAPTKALLVEPTTRDLMLSYFFFLVCLVDTEEPSALL
jgi:hypothetical protein